MVNIAALAPMPSARVTVTVSARPRVRSSDRTAILRSAKMGMAAGGPRTGGGGGDLAISLDYGIGHALGLGGKGVRRNELQIGDSGSASSCGNGCPEMDNERQR